MAQVPHFYTVERTRSAPKRNPSPTILCEACQEAEELNRVITDFEVRGALATPNWSETVERILSPARQHECTCPSAQSRR